MFKIFITKVQKKRSVGDGITYFLELIKRGNNLLNH